MSKYSIGDNLKFQLKVSDIKTALIDCTIMSVYPDYKYRIVYHHPIYGGRGKENIVMYQYPTHKIIGEDELLSKCD
jgi:hypothetical protein